jgi:hypothetical protein
MTPEETTTAMLGTNIYLTQQVTQFPVIDRVFPIGANSPTLVRSLANRHLRGWRYSYTEKG